VRVRPTTTLGWGGPWPSWLSAPAARCSWLPCPARVERDHGDCLLRVCRCPARLTIIGDDVLHGGHGEGDDEMGEPFLGAGGSGTLPVRVGGDGTAAPSSTSGLRTGTMTGTYVGRWRRVSGGVSMEMMMALGGTAHLVRCGQAAAACGTRIALSAWRARTQEELWTRGPVKMGHLYGTGTMAVPPRAANPGAARGGVAADKRAPHVSAFPFSEILKDSFPHKKNRYKVRKNLRKFLKVGNLIWNTFHPLHFF
jgi:hypothetical protein